MPLPVRAPSRRAGSTLSKGNLPALVPGRSIHGLRLSVRRTLPRGLLAVRHPAASRWRSKRGRRCEFGKVLADAEKSYFVANLFRAEHVEIRRVPR
jgi:hypothetical protein